MGLILRAVMLWGAFFTQALAANWVVSLPAIEKALRPVLDAQDRVTVLLPPELSPHHWQMKPSQLKRLAEADYVVIVDKHLEAPLARWLEAHQKPAVVWRDLPNVTLLKSEETHEHHDHHEGHEHPLAYNPHLWLSPHNIHSLWQGLQQKGWVREEKVVKAVHALKALDAEIDHFLQPVKATPFVVLHDAFAYFEHPYGLNKVGVVDVDANTPMSLRQFHQVRMLVQQKQVHCVIYPDTHSAKTLKRLTTGLGVKLQGLDALGWKAPTLEAWFWQLAKGYKACLTP